MNSIKLFGVAFIVTLILDLIWLGMIAKSFYISQMSPIGRIDDGQFKIILWPAFVVYLLLSTGIVFFALPQLSSEATLLNSFFIGALMGLIVYGVYDMTNYSTLKDFPLQLVFADMAWGCVVCGLTTLMTKVVRDL